MKIHCELWSLVNLPVLRREKLKEIIHIYELVVHTACFVIALSREAVKLNATIRRVLCALLRMI